MPKVLLQTLAALALLPGVALADPGPASDTAAPMRPAKLPIKFEPVANSLQQLLNAGYEIRTSAGDEGGILFLAKLDPVAHHLQWARCELIGDNSGNVRLIMSHHPTADCRVLN